jgi:assimilatory nitrate reductase catalytic subunit
LQVEIHPEDARELGARAGSRVRIISRRGAVSAAVVVTATVQRGQVYLPMHDPDTNKVTLPVFDPYSRQPGYKFCAVRIEKIFRRAAL